MISVRRHYWCGGRGGTKSEFAHSLQSCLLVIHANYANGFIPVILCHYITKVCDKLAYDGIIHQMN